MQNSLFNWNLGSQNLIPVCLLHYMLVNGIMAELSQRHKDLMMSLEDEEQGEGSLALL